MKTTGGAIELVERRWTSGASFTEGHDAPAICVGWGRDAREAADMGGCSDNARQHAGGTNSSSSGGAVNDSPDGYRSPRDRTNDSSGGSAGDHRSPRDHAGDSGGGGGGVGGSATG